VNMVLESKEDARFGAKTQVLEDDEHSGAQGLARQPLDTPGVVQLRRGIRLSSSIRYRRPAVGALPRAGSEQNLGPTRVQQDFLESALTGFKLAVSAVKG